MISTADIGELIRNPELAGNYKPSELAEIRDKFPYCSTLHLLYLKGLSLNNDLQFEDQLRYAAVHVFDRERMYYLVHSGTQSERETETERKVEDTLAVTMSAIANQVTEAETAQKKEEAVAATVSALAKEAIEEETAAANETPVIELKPDLKKTEEPVVEVHEDIAQPIDLTIEPVVEIQKPNLLDAAPDLIEFAYTEDLKEEQSQSGNENESDEGQQQRGEQQQEQQQQGEQEEQEKEQSKEQDLSNLSFIEWLQYKQQKQLPAKPVATEKADNNPVTEEKPAISTEEEPKKTKKTGLSRADVDALLNKFIAEEPSISRPTADFFSPTKTAKQSLEEAPDLVTETLARIYELQKNYPKAIQAYEQLSLVYPEKKTFFAARIQKIKEEQQKQ